MAIGKQVFIGIYAVMVPIAPEKHDGVAAYRLGVFQAGLFWSKFLDEIEPAGHTHLPTATRAGALPSQPLNRVPCSMAVAPLNMKSIRSFLRLDAKRHNRLRYVRIRVHV